MTIVICPEPGCAAPAEVLDRWTFASTDGPLVHLKTRCLHGHCLTPRLDQVISAVQEPVVARSDAAA
jgi:hypothetical protein